MRYRARPSLFTDDILSLYYKEKDKNTGKVCFMSGKERALVLSDATRASTICPNTYNVEKYTSAIQQLLNKKASKAGYGGLASRAPRFVEPPQKETPTKTPTKTRAPRSKSVWKRAGKPAKPQPPFGSSVPRVTGVIDKKEDTPGFYYDITRATRKREIAFDHSFGGRTKMRHHVLWKCVPENTDICEDCGQEPAGDYYFLGAKYLCRKCFHDEWARPNRFTRRQLQNFRVTRDCSTIHSHEGTTSAVPLVDSREIIQRRVKEAYFASFSSPRKVIKGVSKKKAPTQDNKKNQLKILYEAPQTKLKDSMYAKALATVSSKSLIKIKKKIEV